MKQYYFLLLTLLFFSCENKQGASRKEHTAAIDSESFDSLLNVNRDRLLWSNLWEGMSEEEFNFALKELKENKIIETRSEYQCGSMSIIDRDIYDFRSNNKYIRFIFEESFINNKLGSIELLFTSVTQADAPQICTVVKDEINTMINLLSDKYGDPTISELDSAHSGTSYQWSHKGRIIILVQKRNSAKRVDLKHANPKKLPEFASITYKFEETLQLEKSEQKKLDSLKKLQVKKAMERL